MSFAVLTVLPGLCVALAFAVLVPLGLPALGLRVEIELVKVAALVGSLAAARSFEQGDYLRRAWHLSGACFALLLARDLFVHSGAAAQLGLLGGPMSVFVLASNACGVLSAWLMARTFQVAGLATDDSSRRWRVLTALALVAAVLVTLPSLVLAARGVARGEPGALVWLISGVGDVLSLALIAPVLLTAMAMRGGALTYPWALLTAGMLAWLLYDLAGSLAALSLLEPGPSRAIEEFLRGLACVYTGAAGLAQRKVMREGAA